MKSKMKSKMISEKRTPIIGTALTLLGGIFWGLSGACGQYLFEFEGANAKWLVSVRLLTAGLLMVLFYIAKDLCQNRTVKNALSVFSNRRDAASVCLYGIGGMMLCQYAYFTCIEFSNAGTATMVQYISPAMIMLIVCLTERKKPMPAEVVGVFSAFIGIFFIATHGDLTRLAISEKALFWGLLSAIAVVFYNLFPAGLMKRYSTPYLLGWAMLIGGIVLSLIFKPFSMKQPIHLSTLLALAAVILLGTIVSFSFYMQGVKMIGPTKAILYSCIEPVSAALIAAVWLGSSFAPLDILGFMFVISTIFILTFSKTGAKKADTKKTAPEALSD